MAFTYTAGSTAEMDRVRLEIGDTDADNIIPTISQTSPILSGEDYGYNRNISL